MDVLVVGGGLGGLAAATAVRRAGHEVVVMERADELRETGAGIGIMPNGVHALDALGLGGPVRDRAAPLGSGGGLRDRLGRPLLAADQAAVQRRAGAPLAVVARPWLHGLLAAGLPPGTVRLGHAVTAVGPDRVEIDGSDAAPVADLVIVADGARSRLRQMLFPTHPGLSGSGEYAARGIAQVGPAELPAGELLDHRTGERFGCLPMAEGGVYWYASWRPDVVGEAPADPGARQRWLRDRRRDWHPSVAALIDATEHVHVVETAQLAAPLPTFAIGRTALLGDAAHAMTPDLGQGACQAFEDAVVLGRAVSGCRPADVPAALVRYDAARRAPTTDLQRRARRANRMLTLRGRRARLRDAALRGIPAAFATRALAARFAFAPADQRWVIGT